MNINKRKEEKREREEFLFFLKVLAPLEYKNLKRAVSFDRRNAPLARGQEAHGGLTYTTGISLAG